MPDIGSDVAFRISQTGAEQVKADIEGVVAAQGKAAQGSKTWTGFIREERAEHRQRSFVLREGTQALSTMAFATIALSSATGNATKEAQQLSRTLLSGVMAFQGADFAISGIARAMGFTTGGLATAISVVIGLGISFYSFLDNSAERAKKAAEQMKLFADINKDFAAGIGKKQAGKEATAAEGLSAYASAQIKMLQAEKGRGGAIAASEFDYEAEQQEAKRQKALDEQIAQFAMMVTAQDAVAASRRALIAVIEQQEIVEKREAAAAADALRDKLLAAGYGTFLSGKGGLPALGMNTPAAKNQGTGLGTIGFKEFKPVKIDETFSWLGKFGLRELDKMNVSELRFLGLLEQSAGALSNAVSFLGVKTDSLVAKLLEAAQQILNIMRLIEGFKTIGSVIGLAAGSPVGIVEELTGDSVRAGTGTSITINAIDAKSFSQMLSNPDSRRALVNALNNTARLGIN
jgi:hypothetical protein